MSKTTDTDPGGVREWALAQLECPPTADEQEIRRHFLKLLHEQEFVVDTSVSQAYELLAGGSAAACPAYLSSHRASLDEQVRAWASGMFSLDVNERHQQWESLADACTHAPLVRAELDRLKPAVSLDFSRLQLTDSAHSLVAHLRELFLLPPADRAHRRSEILQQLEPGLALWERAARELKRKHPKIAALDASFIDQLSAWTNNQSQLRRKPRVMGPAPNPVAKSAADNSQTRYGWGIVLVIFVMGSVGRFFTHQPTRSQPKYQAPQVTLPQVQPSREKQMWELLIQQKGVLPQPTEALQQEFPKTLRNSESSDRLVPSPPHQLPWPTAIPVQPRRGASSSLIPPVREPRPSSVPSRTGLPSRGFPGE